jgi:hypothetical protein
MTRRGIRVIVGHYKGDQSPSPNFTWDELNVNRKRPPQPRERRPVTDNWVTTGECFTESKSWNLHSLVVKRFTFRCLTK